MTDAAGSRSRRTRIPVTTMEDAPILSEAERAELLASLEKAKAEIAAGDCVEHESAAFVDRLLSVRAAALAAKQG